MIPAFPALAAFVASAVGYHIPVVCQQLTPETTITYAVGSQTYSTPASPGSEQGFTQMQGVPIGTAATISVAGQTVTLPTAPTSTAVTTESPTAFPPGFVGVPGFIALANCDGWRSQDPSQRGQALIVAVHEAMHAKYADANEAATECRTMQLLPTALSYVWASAVYPPGPEPRAPKAPVRSLHWRKLHPIAWRGLLQNYQEKKSLWRALDGAWHIDKVDWANYHAILRAAVTWDGLLPPQYHAASSCTLATRRAAGR